MFGGGGEIQAKVLRLLAKENSYAAFFCFFRSTELPPGAAFGIARKFKFPPHSAKQKRLSRAFFAWRRRGDSNSRYRSPRTNDLANRPLQPLGYSSVLLSHAHHATPVLTGACLF